MIDSYYAGCYAYLSLVKMQETPDYYHGKLEKSHKQMYYGSSITDIKNITDLQQYAQEVLKLFLNEDNDHYIINKLEKIEEKMGHLPTREEIGNTNSSTKYGKSDQDQSNFFEGATLLRFYR